MIIIRVQTIRPVLITNAWSYVRTVLSYFSVLNHFEIVVVRSVYNQRVYQIYLIINFHFIAGLVFGSGTTERLAYQSQSKQLTKKEQAVPVNIQVIFLQILLLHSVPNVQSCAVQVLLCRQTASRHTKERSASNSMIFRIQILFRPQPYLLALQARSCEVSQSSKPFIFTF